MNNNAGKRSPRLGANLKLLGLLPGLSDLFIFYPSPSYHGLFLEIKRNKVYTPSERRTPTWIAQEEFLKRVNDIGYCGKTCYGLDDGIKIIKEYLGEPNYAFSLN